MKKFLVVTSLMHMISISVCAPSKETHRSSNTTYDQRQVGKYNIHFNIKDVAIIAVSSEDIVDHIGDSDAYDDYYDYEESEYTVNPITADLTGRPTTAKPLLPSIAGLNLSEISASTESSEPVVIPQTLVVIHEKPSSSQQPDKNGENADKIITAANETVESASISYQPDEIPVKVIVEPLLKPKIRKPPQPIKRKLTNRQVSDKTDVDDEYAVRPRRRRGQMVERMRARRAQNRMAHTGNGNGCGRGETNDGQGGCRIRRSGMNGFLDMLTRFLPKGDSE